MKTPKPKVELNKRKYTMFHLSTRKSHPVICTYPEYKKGRYEAARKAVCVAPTIDHCIIAIWMNYYSGQDMVFNVFRPDECVEVHSAKGRVWDEPVTKEHWITENVRWKLEGSVIVNIEGFIMLNDGIEIPQFTWDHHHSPLAQSDRATAAF